MMNPSFLTHATIVKEGIVVDSADTEEQQVTADGEVIGQVKKVIIPPLSWTA